MILRDRSVIGGYVIELFFCLCVFLESLISTNRDLSHIPRFNSK